MLQRVFRFVSHASVSATPAAITRQHLQLPAVAAADTPPTVKQSVSPTGTASTGDDRRIGTDDDADVDDEDDVFVISASMFNNKTVAATAAGGVAAAAATNAPAAADAPFHPFQMLAPPKPVNRQPKQTPITDDFEITTTVLGQGINGKVVKCTNRKTGQMFALKVLNDNSKARREVDLHWRASGCRHIVQIVAVYENTYGEHKCLLVVMEW